MVILSFIGIILSFFGTVLISAGLIKSKEATIDEQAPYWGPNPFKLKEELNARNLALWGFVVLIAGFAISAVVELSSIVTINELFGAISAALALMLFGWLILLLVAKGRSISHINHKHRHNRISLISRVNLQIESISKILDGLNPEGYNFESVKLDNVFILVKFIPSLDIQSRETLENLLSNLKQSKNFQDLKKSMEDGLASLTNHNKDKE